MHHQDFIAFLEGQIHNNNYQANLTIHKAFSFINAQKEQILIHDLKGFKFTFSLQWLWQHFRAYNVVKVSLK